MLVISSVLIEGLSTGAAYGLLAVGLSLLFGVAGRINLAYGPCLLIGATAAAWAHAKWQLGVWPSLGILLLFAAISALYVERVAFAPIRLPLSALVASYAVWMQLEEIASLALPGHANSFPGLGLAPLIETDWLVLRSDQAAALPIALIITTALDRMLYASRMGLRLRMVACQPVAAALVGVPVGATIIGLFVLTAFVGGLGTILLLVAQEQTTAMLGMTVTIKAITAAILGGMGTVWGAFAGGLLLGLLESVAQAALGATGRELATVAVLFLVLVLRPGGAFGGRLRLRRAAAELRA